MTTQVAEKQFVCACGFGSNTKSGLANHKRNCPQSNYSIPGPGVTPVPPPAPVEPPLTTADRNQFAKRISDRRDTMLKALEEELDGRPEKVLETLRREKGVTLTVEQLNELIEGIERQIEEEIEEHIADEDERIKVAIGELDEKYEEKEHEMKERHRKEWGELLEKKKAEKADLNKQLKATKERVTQERAGNLQKKKEEYQTRLLQTRQAEQEIKLEANTRVALLQRSKGRLRHTICDCANRALEDLLVTSTRSGAGELLKKIPTVSEAISMCQSPEGFGSLLKRLDPSMQLPAPINGNDHKDGPTIELRSVNKEEDEEDEEEEEDDDHDEIYEEERPDNPFRPNRR